MTMMMLKQSLLLPLLYAGAHPALAHESIVLLQTSHWTELRLGNGTAKTDVPSVSSKSRHESAAANAAADSDTSKSSTENVIKNAASHSITDEGAAAKVVAPSVAGHIFSASPIQRVAVKASNSSATDSPSDKVESSIGGDVVAAVTTPIAAVRANEQGASSIQEEPANTGLIDATKPKEAAWFEAFDQSESTYTKDGDKGVGNSAVYHGGEMDTERPVPYDVPSAKRAGWFQETPSGGAKGAWQTYPAIETASVGPHDASHLAWHESEGVFMPDYNEPVNSRGESEKHTPQWFDEAVTNYDSFGRKMPPKVAIQSLESDESEALEAAKAKPTINDHDAGTDDVQASGHEQSAEMGAAAVVADPKNGTAKQAKATDASAQAAPASSENATSSNHEGVVEGESSFWQTLKDGAKHVAHAVTKGAHHVAQGAKHVAAATHSAVKDAVAHVRSSSR